MLREFKEFAMKGSVLDMAIGIIIGGAFTPIVKSLVGDVIMPPLGLVLSRVDLTNMHVVLRPGTESAGPYETVAAAREAGAVTLNYGTFIGTVVTFLLIAFIVFLLVKAINRWKRDEEAAAEVPAHRCPFCRSEVAGDATRCPACTAEIVPARAPAS